MRRASPILVIAALAALAPPALAVPHARQMVVFRSGPARVSHPSMTQTTVRVRGKRCTVPGATPLAALVHSRVAPLTLRDYGSCSKRPSDAGGLFVAAIGSAHNRGSDGWVYKVGNVLGTAGAADPSGPFGRGRMRAGTRITWFWCHVTARNGGCPHTLGVGTRVVGRTIIVRVRHFNDFGRGRVARGARVHVGARRSAVTGRDGTIHIRVPRGSYRVWATQAGRVRSFARVARVR